MALLKDVRAKVPSADTVAGRVIAHHCGKHYDLGQYAGDGVVMLSEAGAALLAELEPVLDTPAPRSKRAGLNPSINSDLGSVKE